MKKFKLVFVARIIERPLLELLVEIITGLERRMLRRFLFRIHHTTSMYKQDCEFIAKTGTPFEEISNYEYIDNSNGILRSISHSSRKVFTLSDVLVDLYYGNVFNSKKFLIEESTVWSEFFLSSHVVPAPLVAKKICLNDSTNLILPSNSFYHFFLEDFPDFLRIYESYPNSNVIIWDLAPTYVTDALQYLNISFTQTQRFISLQSLSFVEKSKTVAPSAGSVKVLKHSLKKDPAIKQAQFKVYVSRVGDARSPSYEKELIQFLELSGEWTILNLSRLTFSEQLAYASSAKVWAGHHGAGLSWIPLLPSDSVVIEIGPAKMECFQQLASLSDIPFFRIRIETDCPPSAKSVYQNICLVLGEPCLT